MNEKRYISDKKILTKATDIFEKLENMTVDKIANLLKNNPECLNLQDPKSGSTLLFKAVALGNFEAIEFLLNKNANPDIQNIYGETPLHLAVENGNYKIITILLEKGGNPNIQQQVINNYLIKFNFQDGETPMHIAAVKGEYIIIKLLLLFNASPFIFTYSNYYSPLDYARESKKIEALKVLQPVFDARQQKVNYDKDMIVYEKKVNK